MTICKLVLICFLKQNLCICFPKSFLNHMAVCKCSILLVGLNFILPVPAWPSKLHSVNVYARIPKTEKPRHAHSLGLQWALQELVPCWLLLSISSLASLTFHSKILGTISKGVVNAYVCLSNVLINKLVIITKSYLMKSLSLNNSRQVSFCCSRLKDCDRKYIKFMIFIFLITA